jgi:cytosine/adenosine deaminase-related metal-dependent hydrolase
MDETQLVDVWTMFKEYLDKKHIEMAAERFVDLMADFGTTDQSFIAALGHDSNLDAAINYYLDLDEEDVLDEEVEWD